MKRTYKIQILTQNREVVGGTSLKIDTDNTTCGERDRLAEVAVRKWARRMGWDATYLLFRWDWPWNK